MKLKTGRHFPFVVWIAMTAMGWLASSCAHDRSEVISVREIVASRLRIGMVGAAEEWCYASCDFGSHDCELDCVVIDGVVISSDGEAVAANPGDLRFDSTVALGLVGPSNLRELTGRRYEYLSPAARKFVISEWGTGNWKSPGAAEFLRAESVRLEMSMADLCYSWDTAANVCGKLVCAAYQIGDAVLVSDMIEMRDAVVASCAIEESMRNEPLWGKAVVLSEINGLGRPVERSEGLWTPSYVGVPAQHLKCIGDYWDSKALTRSFAQASGGRRRMARFGERIQEIAAALTGRSITKDEFLAWLERNR